MEAYWLFTVCVLAFHAAVSGYTLTANGKETLLTDAIKEYVSQVVSEVNKRHARDIHELKDIIDLQQKQIEGLQSDKVVYRSFISELENRVASLESIIGINKYNDAVVANFKEDTKSSSGTAFAQGEATQDTEMTSEKPVSFNQQEKKPGKQRRVRRAITGDQVAFSASMTHQQEHLGQGQDIAFDHLITNIGNAYNGHHGTFVAPVAGTYVFYFSLHSPGARADLVVNGSVIANLYIGNDQTGQADQSSQLVIVTLKQGDDVSVKNMLNDKLIWGTSYSTFSGFLLYEGTDDVQIVG